MLEQKVEKLLHRLVETDNPTVIQEYEEEITRLDEQKILFRAKIDQCGRPVEPFEDCFRTAMNFLSNPCHYWSSARLDSKRMVLRLVFAKKLPYQRNERFRTAKNEEISLPFRFLRNLTGGKYEMVRPVGIEPTTLSLEG